jgi:hypothetical protein
MGRKIQVRRGTKAELPTLSEGELGYCTDTKELYIGTGTEEGNELLNKTYETDTNIDGGSFSEANGESIDGGSF